MTAVSDACNGFESIIQDLLETENVHTLFQPTVSISTRQVVGFEAYTKGGEKVSSEELFQEGGDPNLKLQLDRLCRKNALELFKPISDTHKDLLLFLNIDPDIVKASDVTFAAMLEQVKSIGVAPGQVVAETPLKAAMSEEMLALGNKVKEAGFMVGVDKCGVDDSFTQAISLAKPHFVKIDRTFYGEDQHRSYSQEAIAALRSVTERVGTSIIAQNVETEKESIQLMSAGIHLQQGYYYSKDKSGDIENSGKNLIKKLSQAYEKFKQLKEKEVWRWRKQLDAAIQGCASVCNKLQQNEERDFDSVCTKLVGEGGKLGDIYSLFVLKKGEQITTRIHVKPRKGWLGSNVLLGARRGVDHSMHRYATFIEMGFDRYVTRPFTSQYTGTKACIISQAFFSCDGSLYTLCMEVPYPE